MGEGADEGTGFALSVVVEELLLLLGTSAAGNVPPGAFLTMLDHPDTSAGRAGEAGAAAVAGFAATCVEGIGNVE